MKKKLWVIFLVAVMVLTACGKQGGTSSEMSAEGNVSGGKKVVTVTTSFLYDMVKNLAGDKVDLELIIPAGENPHLYLAKSANLQKIQKADLLLYHGIHFEGKMQETLKSKEIGRAHV